MTRRDHISYLFRQRFGSDPDVWVRAPGRVDLMGSHTDYNLGFVLTMAISRDTWIALRRNGTRDVRVHAADLNADDCLRLDAIERNEQAAWSNYVRGVAAVLANSGRQLDGFDGVIHSTVPLESGLSSSAALECATAAAFRELGGWSMDARRMALLCQEAENQFVGVKCGILDQFSSCLGEKGCALLLDCRDLSTRPVPISSGMQVLICDTRSPRRLAGGEYAERRRQCEHGAAMLGVAALGEVTPAELAADSSDWPDDVRKRSRFIVEENERVPALARALQAGDRDEVRRLMLGSFEALEIYSRSAHPRWSP